MPHESTRRIVRSSNKQSIDNHKENAENELKSSSSSVKQQQQITNDDSQKLQLKTQKETSIGKTIYTYFTLCNMDLQFFHKK